jgi:hypothetical protein
MILWHDRMQGRKKALRKRRIFSGRQKTCGMDDLPHVIIGIRKS